LANRLAAAAIASPAVAMTMLGAGSVDGASASLAAGLGGGLMVVVGHGDLPEHAAAT